MLALPNQRWSLDFVHDQLVSGRRFRVLNIVDDVTRECIRAEPAYKVPAMRSIVGRQAEGVVDTSISAGGSCASWPI